MIKIKVINYIDKFLEKCINNNINLYNIKRYKDYLTITIKESDLENIKKINYQSKIEVIKSMTIKTKLKKVLKYKYDFLLLIFFITTLYILSNTIINIEIKHENKEIKNQIKEILKKNNIKILTIKKDIKTLNKISESIISENKNFIEWISINNIGMKYIVSIEDRIIPTKEQEEKYCNIISTHDSIITKINSSKGLLLVEKNKLVHKGDLLVSGDIILNDEIKESLCAKGDIYGETWYKIHISYPYTYATKEYTKNKRINFKYKDKYFYKKNYKNYEEKVLYKIKDFKIVEQREYNIKEHKYTYKEAKKQAIKNTLNKLLEKTGTNSKIIDQKVLKETQNNSKIELDIFVSIEQIISKRITYKVGEEFDTR